MWRFITGATATVMLTVCVNTADAASAEETIAIFRQAGESANFFAHSYAYAVFPTVGAGAIGIGGAYGKGNVYVQGKLVGGAKLSQVSVGFQLGGKAYSEIIFFEDKAAFDQFASGKFEFGADASAVAVTSSANADIATNGVHTGVSEGQHNAETRGSYQLGMATFIVAKGGLMASASIAGQKIVYVPGEALP
jgi:lipid-binding SYLF domain-containing protein